MQHRFASQKPRGFIGHYSAAFQCESSKLNDNLQNFREEKKSHTKTFASYPCFLLAPSFGILLAFNILQLLNGVRRNLGLTRNTRVWYVSFQHLQQAGCSSLVAHLIQERRSSKLFPNQEQVRTFDKKDLFSCSLSILGQVMQVCTIQAFLYFIESISQVLLCYIMYSGALGKNSDTYLLRQLIKEKNYNYEMICMKNSVL